MNRHISKLSFNIGKLLRKPQRYRIGSHTIELTPDHLLPIHQRSNPNYDKFLPYLAKNLSPNDLIIDVGANCGDTLAGMHSEQPNACYVCIEADSDFFAYLANTTEVLRRTHPETKVFIVKNLVGQSSTTGAVTGKGGTKTLQASGAEVATPLDDIVIPLLPEIFDTKNRIVIKVDVDGYDYDVLKSAKKLLSTDNCIVFYECHATNMAKIEAYRNHFSELEEQGFKNWWAFDNVGKLILSTDNIDILSQLIEYTHSQQVARRKTINYIDVLACKQEDAGFLAKVVKSYNNI